MQASRGAPLATARQRWLSGLVALAIIGADQISKVAVVASIPEGGRTAILGDWLSISHFRNTGAAFSLFPGYGGLIALLAAAGTAVFAVMIVKQPGRGIPLGAGLVAGGAVGNLLDRLLRGPIGRGGVIDWFDLSFWPTFNVADAAIVIGAGIIVLSSFRRT